MTSEYVSDNQAQAQLKLVAPDDTSLNYDIFLPYSDLFLINRKVCTTLKLVMGFVIVLFN